MYDIIHAFHHLDREVKQHIMLQDLLKVSYLKTGRLFEASSKTGAMLYVVNVWSSLIGLTLCLQRTATIYNLKNERLYIIYLFL